MKTKLVAIFASLFLICNVFTVSAQSSVFEISWISNYVSYNGLLVLNNDNRGLFKVKYYNSMIQSNFWVSQKAVLTNQYDNYGNCMSYIYCSYPVTEPYTPYAADNFLVYPNGAMYTQDAGGSWSTLITATKIAPQYWQAKLYEYNID